MIDIIKKRDNAQNRYSYEVSREKILTAEVQKYEKTINTIEKSILGLSDSKPRLLLIRDEMKVIQGVPKKDCL